MTDSDPDPATGAGGAAVLLALGIPAGVAGVLGSLLVGSPRGAGTGLLGPWAGTAVGHVDCTMATQLPMLSFAMALGGAGLTLAAVVVPSPLRPWVVAALVVWALVWAALGVMSMLNASL